MCSDAFDDFFRCELGPLVGFLRRAGFEPSLADDAAAEAMTRAYQNWATIDLPARWVRRTAYRFACGEVVRAREGTRRAVAGGWTVYAHHDADIAGIRDERHELLELLGQLPEQQRRVMALHLEDFDDKEISERMGMRRATVRSNLRHARERLKALYQVRVDAREVRERGGAVTS